MLVALWQNPQPARRKLNDLLMANSSTPLDNRAFLLRNLPHRKHQAFFSQWWGVLGNRLRLCIPLVAVSYPDTLYRQAVGSKAVDMKNLLMGLCQML